ncbi:unannotated protein [freshwater metagenome]|uniref:Unannotated protein n=1 Tax=freshwater metagenome TaxID=449393 RepID=A0A6J7UR12_9ZZZZ
MVPAVDERPDLLPREVSALRKVGEYLLAVLACLGDHLETASAGRGELGLHLLGGHALQVGHFLLHGLTHACHFFVGDSDELHRFVLGSRTYTRRLVPRVAEQALGLLADKAHQNLPVELVDRDLRTARVRELTLEDALALPGLIDLVHKLLEPRTHLVGVETPPDDTERPDRRRLGVGPGEGNCH